MEHPDSQAVQKFADAMKHKMSVKRMEGRRGWRDECTTEHLANLLVEHISKGDPVDIGNFAMMLFNRNASHEVFQKAMKTHIKMKTLEEFTQLRVRAENAEDLWEKEVARAEAADELDAANRKAAAFDKFATTRLSWECVDYNEFSDVNCMGWVMLGGSERLEEELGQIKTEDPIEALLGVIEAAKEE